MSSATDFVLVQTTHDMVELVEQLFEPQLVHLMDDDEQRFVMLGAAGLLIDRHTLLKREEFGDLEVTAVREGVIIRCGVIGGKAHEVLSAFGSASGSSEGSSGNAKIRASISRVSSAIA